MCPRTASVLLTLLSGLLLAATEGQAGELTLRAQLASDFVVRGVSHTDGEPVIGGLVEVDLASGWFVGASGYYASESPVPNLTRGYRGYLGWFRELGDERALELSLARNEFSGSFTDDWDYTELRADLHLGRRWSATLAASDDYYGRDAESARAALTWQPELGAHAYLRFTAGALRLWGGDDDWLAYGEGGLGFRRGRLDLFLGAARVDDGTAALFPSSGRSTLWLRVDWLLR